MGYNNADNYTHFAVNKQTGKIINGWDYSGYDPSELKMYKKDYFIDDLVDMEFNPNDYKILTKRGCLQQGINPNDDSQWSNDGINESVIKEDKKYEIKNLSTLIEQLRASVKNCLPQEDLGDGIRGNVVDDIILNYFYDYDNWTDYDADTPVIATWYGLYELGKALVNYDLMAIKPDGTINLDNSNHPDVAQIAAQIVPHDIFKKIAEYFGMHHEYIDENKRENAKNMRKNINENQLNAIIAESIKKIILKESTFRGVPNTRFIWHGEWSDPEIEYNGQIYNYYDVENALWEMFVEEYPKANDPESDTPELDAAFDKFCQENAESVFMDLEPTDSAEQDPFADNDELDESKTNRHNGPKDYISAMRKGQRDADMEMYGPGFKSGKKIHKTSKMDKKMPKKVDLSKEDLYECVKMAVVKILKESKKK